MQTLPSNDPSSNGTVTVSPESKRKPRQPNGYYRAIEFACKNCGINSKLLPEILSHNAVGLLATAFELEPEMVANDILKLKKRKSTVQYLPLLR